MHIPAQSQEHVRLNDVLLQLHPSLPTLRRKLPSLVRTVHRYYGAVRLLQHVHVRRAALGLHGPAFANRRRRTGDLPVLVHVVFSACTGSNDYAEPVNCSRVTQPPYCLPPTHQGVGILIHGFSKLNHPAHQCLDLRFATHLAMCHARLEVRMDSLFPFLQGLAPLQHVGLSRRTVDDRPFRSYFLSNVPMRIQPAAYGPRRRPPLGQNSEFLGKSPIFG